MEGNKEVEEENMYTAVLTAGVILSMVCLKHSPAMAFLFEQWRAWVFFVLNLVLLAIFFTSTRSSITENQDCKNHHASTLRIQENKRRKPETSEEKLVAAEAQGAEEQNLFGEKTPNDGSRREREDEMEPNRLSNEELNDRVEAFIAMFRRHLVSDERKCRDRNMERIWSRPTQADILNSSKGSYSNMNIPVKEVACSV